MISFLHVAWRKLVSMEIPNNILMLTDKFIHENSSSCLCKHSGEINVIVVVVVVHTTRETTPYDESLNYYPFDALKIIMKLC